MNVATWAKSNSKEENFNQFQQGIRKLKGTLVKVTNVQNEKLDKLSDITEKHKKGAKWNTQKDASNGHSSDKHKQNMLQFICARKPVSCINTSLALRSQYKSYWRILTFKHPQKNHVLLP